MSELFNRKCVVLVGKQPEKGTYKLEQLNALKIEGSNTLRIEGLRVVFNVRRDDQPHPNTSEITIFNLSADSRRAIEGKGQRVVLQAGYGDELADIFSGDARRIISEKQGADWVTKIEAGDGERAHRWARMNESYSPGTRIADVVKRTIKALAPDPGTSLTKASTITGEFSKGYAQHGSAAAEMARLMEKIGWNYSLQDGRLELFAKGELVTEEVPLISPDSGLVGSPTWASPTDLKKPARVRVRSLLLGHLRPRQKFQLKSAGFNGAFRSHVVTHTGDTHGMEWFTDIEAATAS